MSYKSSRLYLKMTTRSQMDLVIASYTQTHYQTVTAFPNVMQFVWDKLVAAKSEISYWIFYQAIPT